MAATLETTFSKNNSWKDLFCILIQNLIDVRGRKGSIDNQSPLTYRQTITWTMIVEFTNAYVHEDYALMTKSIANPQFLINVYTLKSVNTDFCRWKLS